MAVLQMQKLCICALKKDRKSLMEFLQAAGVLELSAEAEPDEVFKRTDTLEDRQKFERNAATADRALEALAAVVPEETSMLAGLAGKPLAKAGAYRETEANAEALLGQAERILNLQKQITEEKTAALRLLAEAESLKPWQKTNMPMRCSTKLSTRSLLHIRLCSKQVFPLKMRATSFLMRPRARSLSR